MKNSVTALAIAYRWWCSCWLVICALLLLLPPAVSAQSTTGSSPVGYVKGKVLTRGIKLGEIPQFAELDENGQAVAVIGEASGALDGATVLSAASVRAALNRYQAWRSAYPDAHVLIRADYEARSFTLPNGEPATKPALAPDTQSVVVRAQHIADAVTSVVRWVVPSNDFVLLESAVVLEPMPSLNESSVALLVTKSGAIRHQSVHSIGFKTQETIPVEGASVYWAANGFGTDYTDAEGKYFAGYSWPPCYGYNYFLPTYLIMTTSGRFFNPRSAVFQAANQILPFHVSCIGFHSALNNLPSLSALTMYTQTAGILSGLPTVVNRDLDFFIDLMVVSGNVEVRNSLSAQDAVAFGNTSYSASSPNFERAAGDYYDLNNDGRADTAVLCGDKLFVFFFGAPATPSDPCQATSDVIRVPDTPLAFNHEGLLSAISRDDLIDTDLYVFRASNDKLIAERKGGSAGLDFSLAESASPAGLRYDVPVPGPYQAKPEREDFSAWGGSTQLDWKDVIREANRVRPGEFVKVIALNRATGYVGSAVTQLQSSAGVEQNRLGLNVPSLVMRPPNLSIKAERSYKIGAGLTKDEDRENVIGFEGSALQSDSYIALTTEWYDHDGTPLPPDLPGYTGRMAKITDVNTLTEVGQGSQVGQFAIQPGKRLQVVALPSEADFGKDHYYLHVCGQSFEWRLRCSFETDPSRSGTLQNRPHRFVPVKTALYDEVATRLRKLNFKIDEPIYRWPYRPEMQFTVFDLTLRDITMNASKREATSLSSSNEVTLSGQRGKLELSYDLIDQVFTPLPRVGPVRELVFNLAGAEVMATLGTDQRVQFDDPRFLNLLAPADYLTLGLLQNDDAANVLWEYVSPKMWLWADTNRNGEIDTDYSDDTSPAQPFIFWVNDDADMVLDQGVIRDDIVECPADTAHATCEEDDVNNLRSMGICRSVTPTRKTKSASSRCAIWKTSFPCKRASGRMSRV